MTNSIFDKLEDSYLLIVILVLGGFILHAFFLKSFWNGYTTALFVFLVLCLLLFLKSEKYEAKYKECKIIGDNLNNSVLSHRIKDISYYIPNHHLIFLGGFVDDYRGEMLGGEGVLIIDSDYYEKKTNGSIDVYSGIIKIKTKLSEDSKLSKYISSQIGFSPTIYFAVPKNFKQSFKFQRRTIDIDSTNISTWITSLFKDKEELEEMLSGNLKELRKKYKIMNQITKPNGFFQKQKTENNE